MDKSKQKQLELDPTQGSKANNTPETNKAIRNGRILVVDDEAGERYLIGQYLRQEGYLVQEAADGVQALEYIKNNPIDLALVDVMMPEMDGFELVRNLRPHYDIPIIFVTARGEEAQRVAGLELGGDDYVIKPFSAIELIARVRAQLRRRQGLIGEQIEQDKDDILSSRAITLSKLERRCYLYGQPIELTRREFDLLAEFLSNPGRVLTRNQLLDAVWGETYLGSRTVDVHIASLRRKLDEELHVTSLRGVGYRLEPS